MNSIYNESSLRKPRGLIFDFNGVLLKDSMLHEKAWRCIIDQYSSMCAVSKDDFALRVHGRNNAQAINYLTRGLATTEEIEKISVHKEEVYRALCLQNKDIFRMDDDTINLLNALKESKCKMTIATSTGMDNLEFYFKHLSLATWFSLDSIIYSDGVVASKPKPDPYIKAARMIQCLTSDCVVIEDALSGLTSAKDAGIGMIVALCNDLDQKKMLDGGAHRCISKLSLRILEYIV